MSKTAGPLIKNIFILQKTPKCTVVHVYICLYLLAAFFHHVFFIKSAVASEGTNSAILSHLIVKKAIKNTKT